MRAINLESFTRAYVAAAIWQDDALSLSPAVFDPEALAAMQATCAKFIAENQADLNAYVEQIGHGPAIGEQHAGHDFALTRNGHGAGFWDRGLGELGERLSEAARAYKTFDLYEGDDGFIYVSE